MASSQESAKKNPAKPRVAVVSALLRHNERFLILERSQQVGSFQGYWSCVSGYLENGEEPKETAIREVEEEVGIVKDSLTLAGQVGPNVFEKEQVVFEAYWFLFDSSQSQVRIDWEHDQFEWVRREELENYKLVPWFSDLIGRLTGLQ